MRSAPLTTRIARAVAVAGVVTALAAGCVQPDRSVSGGADAGTGTTTTGPSGTATTPTPQGRWKLSDWKDCEGEGDLQCATLEVPLDWSEPDGEKISLAVARKPATDQEDRIGSVLFNPGGPGEPGTEWLGQFLSADRIPEGLGDKFDLVSWDPRGTGESAGIECRTDDQLAEPDPDPTLDSAADVAAAQAQATEFAAACKARAGTTLPRVGTVASARDLDALRGALGDEKLTYVGYSYGTTLGAEYLRLFPERTRAMVLDGVSIPGGDPVDQVHDQAKAFEAALDAFLDDCAARSSCQFGDGDPRGALEKLTAKLETGTRLPGEYTLPDTSGTNHTRRGTVGIGELYTGIVVTLYAKENWIALEQALQGASKGNGQLLLYLRDQYAGRQDDGTWGHLADANAAINCADQALRPKDGDGDDALRAAWAAEMPLLGALFATGTPGCFGFPASLQPLAPPTATTYAKAPPVVVVGSTGDPATPYAQSQELAKLLPGSRLVTWQGEDHTAYGRGSDCVDGPLTDYLETLDLPEPGLRCKP